MTVLVGLFKKEKDNRLEDGYMKISVFQNYKMLWNIFKLPNIRMLALALITAKVNKILIILIFRYNKYYNYPELPDKFEFYVYNSSIQFYGSLYQYW